MYRLKEIPMFFEKNIGQHDNKVKFILKQNKCTTYFTEDAVTIALMNGKEDNKVKILSINLEGSNNKSEILGKDELNCKINYFKGREENWITDIPSYEKVIYKEIYPSMDLVYYLNKGNLEHDFIVKPNSNIDNIRFNFKGADSINIDDTGNLEINVEENIIKLLKPIAYQEIEGNRRAIYSSFVTENSTSAKFEIGEYDKAYELVIDPQLEYSTYLGGNSSDSASSVAVDNNEVAYITGATTSITGFPFSNTISGSMDAFLMKIDTTTEGVASLLYAAYIGGDKDNVGKPGKTSASGISLDKSKNAYITGGTNCVNGFPLKNGYQMDPNKFQNCGNNGFLIKINTNVTGGLMYSTYIGGKAAT